MSVNLRCCNTGMTKQLLYNPDISPTIEQMRCKAVTKPVWTGMPGEIGTDAVALNKPPYLRPG